MVYRVLMRINYFFGSDSRSIPAFETLLNARKLKSKTKNNDLNIVTLDNPNILRGKEVRNDFERYCVNNGFQVSYYDKSNRYDDLEIGLVCSFGKIFSRDFLLNNNISTFINKGKRKLINLHLSMLPDLPGPTPVEYSVLYGYKSTGITLFEIDEKIDAGRIIWQEKIEINETDYASDIYKKSFDVFNKFLINQNFNDQSNFNYQKTIFDRNKVKKTYKLQDCDLNLNDLTRELAIKRIRAFDVIGPAKYYIDGDTYKIHTFSNESTPFEMHLTDGKLYAGIITPPGRNKMNSEDWARGLK